MLELIVGEVLLKIRQAIEALEVAENALNEIGSIITRLEELGALYNNNSLLSTSDIASLNAETSTITTIDGIVSGTTLMELIY